MIYINRIVDKEIKDKLLTAGAIVIKGPKWCGKTTSAKQVAKSVLEMQNPDLQDNYFELADIKPSILLEGEKPRLIDEWQLAPKLWNAVRYSIDNTGEFGQYILTGSATPLKDGTMHSGVGRFAFITMKPMALFESGESNGKISLLDLLNKKVKIDGIKSNLTYERIAYIICRGGWPSALELDDDLALSVARNYIDVLCESDISKVDGVNRNPSLARAILKAYARHISTIDSNQTLIDDVKANFADVSDKTICNYLDVFKNLYIIDEIESWNPNIRSKTAIRTSAKKSMIDPSLAIAALGCTPKDIMLDVKTYGLLFENLVNRDLSIYASSLGASLKHYRDRYGLECDNVIHFADGRYALVEIKLGGDKVKEAEEHLLTLTKLIKNNDKLEDPAFMMIITGTDLAYTTEDNIHVVPIGCLKN